MNSSQNPGFQFVRDDDEYAVWLAGDLLGWVRRLPGYGGSFWRAFDIDGRVAGSSFTSRLRAAQALDR